MLFLEPPTGSQNQLKSAVLWFTEPEPRLGGACQVMCSEKQCIWNQADLGSNVTSEQVTEFLSLPFLIGAAGHISTSSPCHIPSARSKFAAQIIIYVFCRQRHSDPKMLNYLFTVNNWHELVNIYRIPPICQVIF